MNTLCLNTDYVLRTGPFDHSANKTTVQSQSLGNESDNQMCVYLSVISKVNYDACNVYLSSWLFICIATYVLLPQLICRELLLLGIMK